MNIDEGRLIVVENIARAVEEGDPFRKVEIGDPHPTDEDIKRVIVPFDNLRRRPMNRIRARVATAIANREARKLSPAVEIVGLENLAGISGGAILTSNHYNPIDSLPPRLAVLSACKKKRLNIVVQESNIFMDGFFGFLMKNCYTLPVSKNLGYMARNLKPAIGKLLARGELVLIYPEAEMWFNYKTPRALMDGAYYYATEFSVPIVPCFTTFTPMDERDGQGIHRLKYTFHIMPPLYPDASLDKRAARESLRAADLAAKRECYTAAYGILPPTDFSPERDIAGFPVGELTY